MTTHVHGDVTVAWHTPPYHVGCALHVMTREPFAEQVGTRGEAVIDHVATGDCVAQQMALARRFSAVVAVHRDYTISMPNR